MQRLEHIYDYCVEIEESIARFGKDYDVFFVDKDYHDVTAFRILKIGELVGNLSQELRTATADQIEWNKIKGMHNVVAHDYGNIELDTLWDTAVHDVPVLRAFCEKQFESGTTRQQIDYPV